MSRHLQDGFLVYYRKITANTTQPVTIVNFFDVIYNSNDVRQWVRPIVRTITANISLFETFPSKFACLCSNNRIIHKENLITIDHILILLYKKYTTS